MFVLLLSLLPIVLAVSLSLITKRAALSLLCGIFVGALILQSFHPWLAMISVIEDFLIPSLANEDNCKVIFFSIFVASTVELIRVGGGTTALVSVFSKFANTRPRALIGTWFAGLTVFFDDYANCLIVGSSMQSIADAKKISREKLAYLVDSTAAPVATLALVSTWIGYEVSLMEKALVSVGRETDAYAFFLQGLPYRFYPILALVFGFTIAITGRDFGPMLKAEQEVLKTSNTNDEHVSPNSSHLAMAVVPLGLLIGVTFGDLYVQGIQQVDANAGLFEIIGAADGYNAMLHGSIASLLSATVLCFWYGKDVESIQKGIAEGTSRLMEALLILTCAWALGDCIGELKTADHLLNLMGDSINPSFLPSIVFVLAAGISFATGTSFGTMGALMPLALPLVLKMNVGIDIELAVASAVLSGATWGDHCSPISDTTILSSAGCGCDHISHVKTQLPYALLSGLIALLFCSLPVGFGIHWSICLLLGGILCVGSVWFFGSKPQ
jgi:Na+/H+ antiporter NhaC